MHRSLAFLSIFSISGLFAQPAVQDSLHIRNQEEVTILGDRAHALPGSGQYIGQKKLENLNQPNINNVLRTVPGVNIRDEEGFGLRPNIGLRGTPVNRSSKITLMEDGILISPAPYADPSAYYFPTFARMQGVEILKGSSQINCGPYTIGGAVNLLSTAIPYSFAGNAQLSYGSFNSNQQRIWVGDSRKNFDYVFEFNRLGSSGFKELDNGGNTGFDRRDIMGKLRWHTATGAKVPQAITLKLVNSSELGNETYLGLTYSDYQNNPIRRYAGTQKDVLDMNHQHASLHHTLSPAKGIVINTTGYYSKTFRDWARANTFGGQSINSILNDPGTLKAAYDIMTGQADGAIDFQSAARTYVSQGLQINAVYNFKTGNISHKVNIGARQHADQADRYATKSLYNMAQGRMILTAEGTKGNQENQIRNANALAMFVRYDITINGLKISPGIRYEKINLDFSNYGNADNARLGTALKTASNDFTVLLPGIGFNYDINKAASLFGGLHKGFSPPGMPSVTSTTGQAAVESSLNYEAGFRYETEGVNLQTAAFLNNYGNILGSDNISGGGAGTGDMFNAGKAKIQGVELSVSYDLLQRPAAKNTTKMPVTLAYTYTSATFQDSFINGGGDWGSGPIKNGDAIPFITPHLITASVGIETKNFNATLIGRYTGDTRVKPGQDGEVTPSENVNMTGVNTIKGFVIIDFSANARINKNFTAFCLVNNITNNQAIVSNLPQGFRPNMPLSFNMGVKVNF